MSNESPNIRMFNDRVRQMNSANSKILTLNAQEARNLHAEIYELLATIADLSKTADVSAISVSMDGGGFK